MLSFAANLLTSLLGSANDLDDDAVAVVEPALFHQVSGAPLQEVPEHLAVAFFGLGHFWAGERLLWEQPGVWSTAVGYAGGHLADPTHEQINTAVTGHAQVVRVVYDPEQTAFETLLRLFWESHDPTQGNRQGADQGSQYRSAIFATTPEQARAARVSRDLYQGCLSAAGLGVITTEIRERAPTFYLAAAEHQQYLARHPSAHAPAQGTGVPCPVLSP